MNKNISLTLFCSTLAGILLLGACSHQLNEESPYLSDKEKSDLFLSANQKRPQTKSKKSTSYILRDSSLVERPQWVEAPFKWANENESNPSEFEYLTYETEPKINRNLACDLSKANIRVDLAIKIAETFRRGLVDLIEQKVSDVEKKAKALSFFNEQFPDRIQGYLKGAQVLGTYWEYREYRKELGANSDFKAYTCASLIRMNKKNIQKAIEIAKESLLNTKLLDKSDPDYRALIESNTEELLKKYAIIENLLP